MERFSFGKHFDIIREKQNEHGQWLMEYDYTGKTWVNFGKRNNRTNDHVEGIEGIKAVNKK